MMMNKVFKEMGETLEVYMEDKVIKSYKLQEGISL